MPAASFGVAPLSPRPFIVVDALGGGGGDGAFSQPFDVALASDDRSGPASAAAMPGELEAAAAFGIGALVGPDLGRSLDSLDSLFLGSSSGLS